MTRKLIFLVLMALAAVSISADELCPCVPISHFWVVEPCDSWNCAASAAIMANGDANVLTMPAPTKDGRWLVVRRVATGAYTPPADAPFVLESFDGVAGASSRFAAIESDRAPMILSAPDGKFLVIMSKDALQKKRASGK
jgi:hypothetical protein